MSDSYKVRTFAAKMWKRDVRRSKFSTQQHLSPKPVSTPALVAEG
jgi:hypothetical protein